MAKRIAAASGTKRRSRLWARPRLVELEVRLAPSTTIPLNSVSWTAIGPAPASNSGAGNSGRTTAIATSPTDPNTVYIGAASGGVWKTTNANSSPPTWTPLTDGQASLTTGDIALAPSNSNVIYAATGEPNNSIDSYYGRGVLKSTDAGATWTLLNDGGVFDRKVMTRVVVSPTDPNTVYAAVYGGGANGAGGNTGIYRSTDGGTTWTNLTAALTTSAGYSDFEIDPTDPTLGYLAIGSAFGDATNGVYKTSDLQDATPTWTRVPTVTNGSGNGRTLIAVSPSSPSTVYAEVDSSASPYNILAFYQSTDSGATWTDRVAGNAGFPVSCPNGQGWYDLGLIVDPTNPNTVIISGSASSQRLQRSTDGGVTWSSLLGSGTNPHVDHHALAFDASGRLLDGDDGGVYRLNTVSPISWVSLNGATTGTATRTALDTNQFVGIAVHPTNANLAIGGTQDNGTQRFNDNLGWTSVDGGDGGAVLWDVNTTNDLYRVSPVGSFGAGAFMRRSTNGGTSFSSITTGIVNASNAQFYPPLALDPATGSHRVFLGTNVVNVLTDGTVASPVWAQYGVALPATNSLAAIGIGASNPNTLYVSSNSGNVYVTTDAGATWQTRTPSSGGSFHDFAVDPTNSNIAYVVSDNFSGTVRIWRTTNAGGTWTSIMGTGLPNVPTQTVALDPGPTSASSDDVLYVGDDQGVYRSTDLGTTWTLFGTGLPNGIVSDLEFNPALRILAAGTYGRGVWEIQTAPGAFYADTHWVGLANGTVITDADPVLPGNQTAIIGTNAFATVTAAIGAAPTGGVVVVNGNDGTGTGNFGEAVNVNKQVTLYLQEGAVTFGSLAGNIAGATITLAGVSLSAGGNNTSTEYDGTITGTTGLTKAGNGTLILTGTNTYSGPTTISGGTLQIGAGATIGSITGNVTNNGTLAFNRSDAAFTFAGTISGTGALLNNGSATLTGAISGGQSVTQQSAGTLTLTALNTFTGGAIVSTGTLKAGNARAFGAFSGTVQVNAGATLDAGGFNISIGSLTLNGAMINSGASTPTVTLFSTAQYVFQLSSTYSIVAGTTFKMVGASGGGMKLNADAPMSSMANLSFDFGTVSREIFVGSGGQWNLVDVPIANGGFNVTGGGALSIDGTTSVTNPAAVTVTAGTLDLAKAAGAIAADGDVTVAGGTLHLSIANQIVDTATITVNSGAFDLNNLTETIGGLAGTGGTVAIGAGTLTVSGANVTTYAGTITGSGGLVLGGAGDLTLTGPNTYGSVGGTTINGGTLSVNSDANLGDPNGPLAFGGGALQALGGFTATRPVALNAGGGTVDTGTFSVTLSAPLNGTGGLTKVGAGTLILPGASGYTGATAVNGGNLLVSGSLAAASAVSVAVGATLSGPGTVGNTTVNGTLAPGNGVGILNTGSLLFNATGTLAIQMMGPTAGTNYSQAIAAGAVNVTGATLSLAVANGFTPTVGTQFDILVNHSGSAIGGTFNNLPEGATLSSNGQFFTISYVGSSGSGPGNDIVLTAAAAPAPPTVASVVVGDGPTAQRSEVRSITVTFSGPVTFAGGNANAAAAFQLQHVQDSTNVANLAAAVSSNGSGQTVVTLTFTTTGNADTEIDPISAQNGGAASLADGRFQLTIFSASVTGSGNQPLAGGGPSGNYVSPADTLGGGPGQLHLYRLFGDATGDGIVDQIDLGQFRATNNSSVPDPAYIAFLDANNDTHIDQIDLGQFRQRNNGSVF
jgi:autotransporter-associated beta strand protein